MDTKTPNEREDANLNKLPSNHQNGDKVYVMIVTDVIMINQLAVVNNQHTMMQGQQAFWIPARVSAVKFTNSKVLYDLDIKLLLVSGSETSTRVHGVDSAIVQRAEDIKAPITGTYADVIAEIQP